MNQLFFELIQVALGQHVCLSHTPSSEEWGKLYEMAKKQSLVGICFASIQRLQKQRQELPEILYLTWMGMASKIQQRNEVLNRQCVELQKQFSVEGINFVILKGQGAGTYYQVYDNATLCYENLSMLRQPGDIDVYVQGGMKKVLDWCMSNELSSGYDYVHTHVNIFKDTEVEIHYRYGYLYNLWQNCRLQKWFAKNEEFVRIELSYGKIYVPSTRFNVVYQLHHIYRHMFVEGIGLRQLMDYYFVLKNQNNNGENIQKTLKNLGLYDFACAVMWVEQIVFGLDISCMICDPYEKEGKYLLDQIMRTGNFGNNRKKTSDGIIGEWMYIAKNSWHLATHYPMEALWTPFWHVYHFLWKRFSIRIYNIKYSSFACTQLAVV